MASAAMMLISLVLGCTQSHQVAMSLRDTLSSYLVLEESAIAPDGVSAGQIVAGDVGRDGNLWLGFSRTSDVAMALTRNRESIQMERLFPRGVGPGDVGYADVIRWTPDGTVVFDRAQSRVAQFDSGGRLLFETPVIAAVGWPAVLDSRGGLHWLSRGRSGLVLRSWSLDRHAGGIATGLGADARLGAAIAAGGDDTVLLFGGSDRCFWRVLVAAATVTPVGCLSTEVARTLASVPTSPSTFSRGRQRLTMLTGMNRPRLVAFGADSAALLLDKPVPSGAIGVVVRFGAGTASILKLEPMPSVDSFNIFIASLSGSGRLLLSNGAEFRFAEIHRPATLQ